MTTAPLIAKAYRRWGADCPRHLLGDYAFAVWDAAKRTLFCARDHAGVRPFYYAETRRGFVFASAIEAVLAGPDVGHELDEFTVGMWLMRRDAALPATSTFFQAVRRLPPGAWPRRHERRGAAATLLRPEDVPRAAPASDDDYAEEFLALYSRAVKDRLCGPGRIGVHLSGGLDSSSVAVLAARELRRQGRPPPPAFTWLPPLGEEPPGEGGEREYDAVGAVAGQEGLQVFLQPPTAADTLALLRCDGAFPQAHVGSNEATVQRAAAAHGVRVLLSGQGGDQGISFSGYGYYAGLLLGGRWAALFAEARARGGQSASGGGRHRVEGSSTRLQAAHSQEQAAQVVAGGPGTEGPALHQPGVRTGKAVPAPNETLADECAKGSIEVVGPPGSWRDPGILGRQRRSPRPGVPVSAAGPPGAGARLEPPAGTVQARAVEPLADAPCAGPRCRPAARGVLARVQGQPGAFQRGIRRIPRGAAVDSAGARRPCSTAGPGPLRRHAAPRRMSGGSGPVQEETFVVGACGDLVVS